MRSERFYYIIYYTFYCALNHQKTIAAIEAVTPEMVMDVAHKVLTAEPCLAVAGKGAEKYAE